MKRVRYKSSNTVYRGVKVRIYPTKDQIELFYRHIHTCRFIWNCMLTIQNRCYKLYGYRYTLNDMGLMLTYLKNREEYSWLNDVSRKSLCGILNDLDEAFKNHKKCPENFELPKFKIKRKYKPSFPINYETTYFKNGYVNIERVGKVKYKSDKNMPDGIGAIKIRNPRVSLSKNNKWILSFAVECDKQTPKKPLYGNMGIDMGVRRLATFSYLGMHEFIPNINKHPRIRKMREKLKYLHRKVGRIYHMHGNYKKSKHIMRIEKQMSHIYHHISNITQDYNHKQTRNLVNLYPRKVVMENFMIKKIIKKVPRPLRREILYAAWYDFRSKMKYKCEEYGCVFPEIDTHFPSTQMCSECGHIKKGKHKLKLSDHVYICKKCGMKLDRDVNAARNLGWYSNYLS